MGVPVPEAQSTTALVGALRVAVAAGRRVLVVGCPPGTFPHWVARHGGVLLWPSTEAKVADERRTVPSEVGAVLVTKMLSFALQKNVRDQAKARGMVCPADLFSPGAVIRLLEPALQPAGATLDRRSDDHVEDEYVEETDTMAMTATRPPAATKPANDDVGLLVTQLDDAIAGLELIRERVIDMGSVLTRSRDQLDTLDALRKLLK